MTNTHQNHIPDAGKMVQHSAEYDPLLRPPEAAEYLGISVSGLRKLCAAGKIKKISLGHRHMAIRLSDLNQFVKKSESKPA